LQKKKEAGTISATPQTPTATEARTNSSVPVTLPKSGTAATLKKTGKGFRSAMSALITGRKRTEIYQKSSKDDGFFESSDQKAKVIDSSSSVSMAKPRGARHSNLPRASRSLTTYENRGMGSPSDVISAYSWMTAPTDKVATDNGAQDRDGAAAFMAQAHQETNASRTRPTAGQLLDPSRRRDDEDPNTPPTSREGPAGHYAEEEGAPIRDRFNESLPGVTAFLDEGLQGAEDRLFQIVEHIDNVEDNAIRATLLRIVGSLEASILAIRQARIANILLHEDVAALVTHTAQFAARAVGETANLTGN
jgi:hypothetical protein